MAVFINITNPPVEDFEYTAVASRVSAGDTVLNVLSGLGFRTNQLLLLGGYGGENAEIVRTHATTAPTNIQITLAGGTRFPYSTNAPIWLMPFDRFRIYQSNDGVNFILADTIDIRPDRNITSYIAAAGPLTRFRIASFNTITGLEGSMSDVISGTGLDFSVVGMILDRVYDLYTDPTQQFIKSDEVLLNYLNEGVFDLWTRMTGLGQGYGVKRTGTPTDPDINMVAGQTLYNQPVDMIRPVKIAMDYSNSGFNVSRNYDPLLKDRDNQFTEGRPGYTLYHDSFEIDPVGKLNGKIRFWYVFMPAPIRSITERPRLPAIDMASKILIDFCVARVYQKAYKTERASYFLQSYENGVTAWLTAISKRRGDWPDQVHSFAEGLEDGLGDIY